METLQIDILDPKAKSLLKELAKLKLISIRTKTETSGDFLKFLKRMRSKSAKAPSLTEINKVVETVRKKRHDK